MKPINFFPFVNVLTSFGGGVSTDEAIVMLLVNALTIFIIFLGVFGVNPLYLVIIIFMLMCLVCAIVWVKVKKIIDGE